MNKGLFVVIFLVVIVVALFISCERELSKPSPNKPPNTTLANIPVEGDTLFALVTLHWDGEDDDGFIEAYEYRYITRHIFAGDSVIHDWVRTEETSVTIPFESSDKLNRQRFQVRAVDNMGDVDPSPAERVFYTVQTIYPETEIVFPEKENQKFFVIDGVTDWWQGIRLSFTAKDKDGEVVEYAWAVDSSEWHWTSDTTVLIGPEFFNPLDGKHKLKVTSRDNTNLVDPVGDSIHVILIRPTWERDILIVDETDESKFPTGMHYKDADVDSFYYKVFKPDTMWDYKKSGMPPKDFIGKFKLLIWHADNYYTYEKDVHKLPEHIEDIMDYMNVGGDFIMSGWRILKSFAVDEPFPKAFDEGTFIHDYLHIKKADESAPIPDFNGAYVSDTLNFSDIFVDSVKLSESYLTSVPTIGLMYVNVIPEAAGFTDVLYRYRNNDYTGIPTHRGYPCGLRYYGTVFDAVVLGFPIFFIKEEDAIRMGGEILRSLGYERK
ncbi:MAG: hypothetical protein DRP91_06250 [Candidatus Neomarinimicrobiota bacterium]|nr:hypothetical protein [Archaeoglobus sp.]RKY48263.1 MAG: hypothetical protein DRP91_06250 [Candidatus Neomarinimicrobiota bacterium]RKY50920.1 MAG: hypothetical protein DRP92_07590 [Candidatus Neomarinimicrobiota bacterium]